MQKALEKITGINFKEAEDGSNADIAFGLIWRCS